VAKAEPEVKSPGIAPKTYLVATKPQHRLSSQSPARNLNRTAKFSRKLINQNFLDNQDDNDVIVEAPVRNKASP
jgi:hypothetical protein